MGTGRTQVIWRAQRGGGCTNAGSTNSYGHREERGARTIVAGHNSSGVALPKRQPKRADFCPISPATIARLVTLFLNLRQRDLAPKVNHGPGRAGTAAVINVNLQVGWAAHNVNWISNFLMDSRPL